jgi:hypothetical protein
MPEFCPIVGFYFQQSGFFCLRGLGLSDCDFQNRKSKIGGIKNEEI